MLIIQAKNIKKYFGTRLIVSIDDFQIYTGDKIGVVGRNGQGKTTLLNILTKQTFVDEGIVEHFGDYSYIPQLEAVNDLPLDSKTLKEWSVEDELHDSMSGGEITRFKLVQCFSKNAHLILADEPTANLDLAGINELEERLEKFDGAVLLVSHDRELLDKVCTKILEIEAGKVRIYPGNYSAYLQQKQEQRERQLSEHQKYLKEKRRLETALAEKQQSSAAIKKAPKRMGNSEARLHKRASGVVKAKLDKTSKAIQTRIDKLEPIERPQEFTSTKIDLHTAESLYSKVALRCSGLSKAFPSKSLFHNLEFTLETGTKVALIGNNGSGKTTLLRMLLGEHDGVHWSLGAKVGYVSQNLDILNPEKTVLENALESSVHPESFVRTTLARLLFRGDEVDKPVAILSGGERVKCGFAKVFLQDINVILLDEPTNYLDIESMEALSSVLQEYEGTVLFISHDRHFINLVADHLLILKAQSLTTFTGNYQQYLDWQAEQEISSTVNNSDQLIVLENRLADITGRLSIPKVDDDLDELDREFKDLVKQIRALKQN